MYFTRGSFCNSHHSLTIEVGAVLITAHCNLPSTKFVEKARLLLADLNIAAVGFSGDRAEYWSQDTVYAIGIVFNNKKFPVADSELSRMVCMNA